MKNFILIGAAGYIAPKHMDAIKETGNNLLAAVDKHDSVGILDKYFPECNFFTEFERFDRHCEKLKRQGIVIDYVVVCSPNYLHDAHIRFGLRIGANVICEKPVVINPWNVDALHEIEKETKKRVFCILQLRLHQSIIALKQKVNQSPKNTFYNIDLKYITSRGNWYHNSWKGDESKSGGIVANIGIHFFDFLIWIFGKVIKSEVNTYSNSGASGTLYVENATICWLLSIDAKHLSPQIKIQGGKTSKELTINNEVFQFSDGFTDLHTQSYNEILKGNGFGLAETKNAIELVHLIRKSQKNNL